MFLSTMVSAASLFATVPMMGDNGDKAINILMLLIMVFQVLIGLPPTP